MIDAEVTRWGKRVFVFTGMMGIGLIAAGLYGKIGGLEKSNYLLTGEVEVLTSDNAGLEQEIGFLESVRRKLVGRVDEAEAGRAVAEESNRQLEATNEQLDVDVAKLEGTVEIMMDKLTGSKMRVATLEQEGRQKGQKIGELEGVRDRLVVANFDLKQELSEARATVADLSESKGILEAEVAGLMLEQNELLGTVDTLASQNMAMSVSNQELSIKVAQLNEEISLKDREISTLRESIALLEALPEDVASAGETILPLILE
ncbi:MAG: hypothetical protein P8J87_07615 [Verrucomicrobiales bacterium]|nr:hypothetical protein [Verrucomicrobiales bacterium]